MARFLPRAIESILAQEIAVSEVVVIDDQSTDELSSVVGRFGGRVRIVAGPGRGSAVARNLGILHSQGDLTAFLDADDYWKPGHLTAAIEALEADSAGVSYSDWQQETGGVVGEPVHEALYSCVSEGRIFSALLRENWILTSSVVLKRSVLATSGIFDRLLIGGQDFELWLRLARITQFARIRQALVVKREHEGNITRSLRYPYHMARVWQTIKVRHPDVEAEDRAYIKQCAAQTSYNAGRSAIRQQDFAAARYYFQESVADAPVEPVYRAWQAMSLLPNAVIHNLHRMKRRIHP
jgi:glycosyltransferase involved in cell wall biosynthesis